VYIVALPYGLVHAQSLQIAMTTESQQVHRLLIDCPDEKGLVHKIAGTLYHLGMNVTSNDEFVDPEHRHFFMRTEFAGAFGEAQLLQGLRAQLPPTANIRLSSHEKKDLVILATKEYHCLGDLLLRHEFGDLHANIRAVVSNHEVLRGLVEKFGLPFVHIPHEPHSREEHERLVAEAVKGFQPHYLVLAKYMRILSPEFVKQFEHQIINIHHSFLPAFIGANPYRQAFNRGVKIIGATAHFVNHELDQGPIITQETIQTSHADTARTMAQAGRDVEKVVLAKALKLVLDDRVFVFANKTVIFG
jgi:formyltetrahydrofolate deformylase